MDVKYLDIMTYDELPNVKNTEHIKYVVFHLIHDTAQIAELETPLFDIFVLHNDTQSPIAFDNPSYVKDDFGKFVILTKTPIEQ